MAEIDVWHSLIASNLDSQFLENAVFLAERLVARYPTHYQSKYLLGLCYYRDQQLNATYATLKSCVDPASRYLFAKCCLDMQKMQEAELSLLSLLEDPSYPGMCRGMSAGGSGLYKVPHPSYKCVPHPCQLNRKSNRHHLACQYYKEALNLNPFLWVAYDGLCQLGFKWDAREAFGEIPGRSFLMEMLPDFERNSSVLTDSNRQTWAGPPESLDTPMETVEQSKSEKPTTRGRKTKDDSKTGLSRENKRLKTKQTGKAEEESKETIGKIHDTQSVLLAGTSILKVLAGIGVGVSLLSQYHCRQAIDCFQRLPPDQYNTGWTLCTVGRAMFEMAEYRQSVELFRKARQLEPFRLTHMDIYSSALWHQRQDVPLSHLAHELTDLNRECPQTWCAAGNCFSSRKDHEMALKCFAKATQIDPSFAYAHTLSGHEYFSIEDLEKAANSFRIAIRIDRRHYNAWYGLGFIYFRQEKYELAEFHFRKSLEINTSNPILIVYLGMVCEKRDRMDEAIQAYERAEKLRPDIPHYAFKRASALLSVDRCQEALQALNPLLESDPSECNVFLLLGKIQKKLGNWEAAMKAFTLAQDLSGTKIAATIKEEIGA
ncbi:anaphase-promoting complex subunit cdc27 [Blyttiomyces sp. JEL0837]|nr:anaphase-promoting complex subunit cdc27 [Blyttiomyces sp. JEL0837]